MISAPWLMNIRASAPISLMVMRPESSTSSGHCAMPATASVTAATPDPDPENNTGTATFEPTRHSSLSLTKTATPITAAAGQVVGYQLTVTNGGPSDAPNVLLTDSLPAGLTAVAVTDDAGGTCTIADEVACRWDTVPAGENRQVSLTGTVAADAPNGALINTAAVTAPVDDPDQTDNAASATIQIASTADLRLAKTATPDPAVRGAPVTYTLNVANAGPQRAELLHLEDPIPTGVTVTAVDDSDCSFDDWPSPACSAAWTPATNGRSPSPPTWRPTTRATNW